jgi:hypothetical protein
MVDGTNLSFLKTYKHSILDGSSLNGSFVRPFHFKKFKFCNASFENFRVTNNSIDFQADMIAYPMILDTYSVS